MRTHEPVLVRDASGTPPVHRSPYAGITLFAAIFALGALLRLWRSDRAYETFLDEVLYADVSRNLAEGDGLTLLGGPFHLHPPALFLMLAGVIRACGLDGDPLDLVHQLRPVAAIAGALSCGIAALLARGLAGTAAGVTTGLLLAWDPFLNRFDSRLLLEAPAMMWSVLGVFLLMTAVQSAPRQPEIRSWLYLASGLTMGLAVLTKDTYAFATVVPLGVLLVLGWGARRRDLVLALATAATTYVVYVTIIVLTGQGGDWWREKGSGVARLVGRNQETGFNAPGSVSLTSRLLANATVFATTYVLILLGTCAAVIVLWRAGAIRARPWRASAAGPAGTERGLVVVAVWQLSGTLFLGFAVLGGTIEEQMFYLLIAPSVVSALVVASRTLAQSLDRALPLALIGSLVLGGSWLAWAEVHARHDDGYLEVTAWLAENVAPGTRIAVLEDTAQFLLTGYDLTGHSSLEQLKAGRDDFALVSVALVERNYGLADRRLLQELDAAAPIAFGVTVPTLGSLRLYDVRGLTGGSR